MITKKSFLDERKLEIYEQDLVNDTDILILIVYCVQRDKGVWEFPAPQIINTTLYEKYKTQYDEQIAGFRNDCGGTSDASIVNSELLDIKEQLDAMQEVLDALLFGEV